MDNSSLLSGSKLFQERARQTLPYLVELSENGGTIFYSDLARLIGIENPRNFNRILGYIGQAIQRLEEIHMIEIPKIQCMVTNKSDGLPGKGIGWFLPDKSEFDQLNKKQKLHFVERHLFEIYKYPHWDWVLTQLGLEPIKVNIEHELKEIKTTGYGGGESKEHKDFKEFIAKNPQVIGITEKVISSETETTIASGDKLDILFTLENKLMAVEVKSFKSCESDVLRGIFQCVKYKAVLEAEESLKNNVETDALLVIEGELSKEHQKVASLLNVHVIPAVKMIRNVL